MSGYYLYLAACSKRNDISFVRGVEAPDLLKKYLELYGLEETQKKYNFFLKTENMPDFVELEERLLQKEIKGKNFGMHYGRSSCPNVLFFWSCLTSEQHENPFWRGYLWHLVIDYKVHKVLKNTETLLLSKEEVKQLQMDWGRVNARISDCYPCLALTPEIHQLGVVDFIYDDKPIAYIDWDALKQTIDYLRGFDPLNGDIEKIIAEVIR